ncbi:MAG TPA: hypothetical protein PLC22_03760 [Gordonia sp. (in: high G+C Gram-positive bacteria)]|nr:hypothetical protein [Gordonia sp. (in: high G+C Gram-positive bacteria)]
MDRVVDRRARAAFHRWQGMDRFYAQVQRALVDPGSVTDEAIDVADALLSAVSHELQSEFVMWRGVRSTHTTFGVNADELEDVVGDSSAVGRFMAGSLDREIAENEFTVPELRGGAALMRVRLAPGVRIGWLPSAGVAELAYQQEALVHPAMTHRIVDIDRSGPIPIVDVEVTLR